MITFAGYTCRNTWWWVNCAKSIPAPAPTIVRAQAGPRSRPAGLAARGPPPQRHRCSIGAAL